MLLLSLWRENQKCRFCGEEFDRYSGRCPYCGSLLSTRKKQAKMQTVEGDGFILLGDPPNKSVKKTVKSGQIGNGRKVLLSVICAAIPGIGPLTGVIAGLIYMDSEQEDRRTFGKALLTASIIMFVLNGVFIYLLALALMTVPV